MSVRCPCCNGTGTVQYGSGRSEAARLRAELVRVYGMLDRLTEFATSHMGVAAEAITDLVAKLAAALQRIDTQNEQIKSLEIRLSIYKSWNGRISDNPQRQKAIEDYRDAARREKADRSGKGGPKPKKTRRRFREEMAEYETGAKPKKIGGQPRHKGRSRTDKPESTVRLAAPLCRNCGTAPGVIVEIIRVRGYDLNRTERRVVCTMYVIRVWECTVCGTVNWPDTELIIRGSSFGPVLRAVLQAYYEAGVSEEGMQMLLEALENASFSVAAISNCISAMAKHMDDPPPALPQEEPLVIRASDALRPCPTPLPPRVQCDFEYDRLEAALTTRSTVWTSSRPLPMMVQIVERASMDPWAATDETTNKIGSEAVFSLVSVTSHTVRVRTVHSKDADTLRDTHGWMVNRPAMRDGTTGFEWHVGRLSRCMVHLTRKSEDFAMQKGLGSMEHVRHTEFRETYGEYKDAMKHVTERAGGPLTCASQLGKIRKIPGLYAFAKEAISKLIDRGNMIIESFPRDGFTTTLENALPNAFNSVWVPGLPGQNNGSEGVVRVYIVPDRNRYTFVNEKAAYNHSILKTFAATCRKNGVSTYKAAMNMAKDPRWSVFNSGIPPPVSLGAGPEDDNE